MNQFRRPLVSSTANFRTKDILQTCTLTIPYVRSYWMTPNRVNENWHRVKTVFWRVDIFAVYTRLLDIRYVVVDNEWAHTYKSFLNI